MRIQQQIAAAAGNFRNLLFCFLSGVAADAVAADSDVMESCLKGLT